MPIQWNDYPKSLPWTSVIYTTCGGPDYSASKFLVTNNLEWSHQHLTPLLNWRQYTYLTSPHLMHTNSQKGGQRQLTKLFNSTQIENSRWPVGVEARISWGTVQLFTGHCVAICLDPKMLSLVIIPEVEWPEENGKMAIFFQIVTW